MTKWIIELEVEPASDSPEPEDWFWTDACPTPDDKVRAIRVEQVGESDG